MSYVRTKKVKGIDYYYLVEGKRDKEGKVKQVVLKYFGREKPTKEELIVLKGIVQAEKDIKNPVNIKDKARAIKTKEKLEKSLKKLRKLGNTHYSVKKKGKKIGSGLIGDVYNYGENHVLKIIKEKPIDRYGNEIDRNLMIDNERRAILYDKEKPKEKRLFPVTDEIRSGEFVKDRLFPIKDFDKIEYSEKVRFGKLLINMLEDDYGMFDEVQAMQTIDGKIKVSDADGFINIKDENESFKNSISYKVNTFVSRELEIGEWITKFATIEKVVNAFEDGIRKQK